VFALLLEEGDLVARLARLRSCGFEQAVAGLRVLEWTAVAVMVTAWADAPKVAMAAVAVAAATRLGLSDSEQAAARLGLDDFERAAG
jgi:hypothetical protein